MKSKKLKEITDCDSGDDSETCEEVFLGEETGE